MFPLISHHSVKLITLSSDLERRHQRSPILKNTWSMMSKTMLLSKTKNASERLKLAFLRSQI